LEVVDDNVTDETLRRLADLRAAVLESKAPDVGVSSLFGGEGRALGAA
jgi:hypothetical protein